MVAGWALFRETVKQGNFLPHSYSDFIYAIIIGGIWFLGCLYGIYLPVVLFRCIPAVPEMPLCVWGILALASVSHW